MAAQILERPGPERRVEQLLTCNNTLAELTIVHSGVVSVTTIPAIIVDVSKSGLRVVTSTLTGPGQQVRIRIKNLIIFGEMRHCHAHDAMFVSGVKISDVVEGHGLASRKSKLNSFGLAGRLRIIRERRYANLQVA